MKGFIGGKGDLEVDSVPYEELVRVLTYACHLSTGAGESEQLGS